ncbi:hypothetical protein LA66_14700 [Aureimonas altamirensis]|uniref:Uncharacterized protein n=1 Tax=Aureimonas altamirensis TaxID=370622 RepID=A0A0B1Q0F9_9HYPH|nr:hypothetical protein LA66_14700 [Aureimonas altamirensis]
MALGILRPARKQVVHNPDFRKDFGVLLSCGKAQDRRQIAPQHDLKLVAIRHEVDTLDQRAECLRGLRRGLLVPEIAIERRNPLMVDLGHVRMQQRRRLVRARQHFGQLRLTRLKSVHLAFHGRLEHALLDGFDDAPDLLLGLFQLTASSLHAGASLDAPAVHLASELGAELLEQPRLHQMRVKAMQYGLLQRIAPDVEPVLADALVARPEAAEQVLRDHRVAASAAAAFDEGGKQVLRPALGVQRVLAGFGGRLVGEGLLSLLGCLPYLLIHDAQLGYVLDDPFALRVEPRDALACVRVLQIAQPVPDQLSDIKLVVEDADAALRIAVDRGRPPFAALRAGDTLAVQSHRDRARGLAGEIVREDATDHGRFRFVDLPFAPDRLAVRVELLDHVVAEAQAAPRLAVLDAPAQAAASLVGEVLEIERAHRPLEADMQFADLAFRQGDDGDAGKAHALVEAGDVLLITRQPVERFREDNIEPALEAVCDKLLNARPDQRCAGDGAVHVAVDDLPALAFGAGTADAELVLDRGVTLVVGGVAGVERDLHETASLFGKAIAGFTLPFGFNEILCGLPCKHADEFDKARVGLRRIVDDGARRRFENQPHPFRCRSSRPCHNAILATERTIPLAAETGPDADHRECEIAGIAAFSGISQRSVSQGIVADRALLDGIVV